MGVYQAAALAKGKNPQNEAHYHFECVIIPHISCSFTTLEGILLEAILAMPIIPQGTDCTVHIVDCRTVV